MASIAALLLALTPGRPQLAVAAAGIGPLLPSFVQLSGLRARALWVLAAAEVDPHRSSRPPADDRAVRSRRPARSRT